MTDLPARSPEGPTAASSVPEAGPPPAPSNPPVPPEPAGPGEPGAPVIKPPAAAVAPPQAAVAPPQAAVAPPQAAVAPPIDPGALAASLATRSGSWFTGLDPHGRRTTIVAAVLMFGVVFGVNFVNAAVPLPQDPGTVNPGAVIPAGPTAEPGQPTPQPGLPTPQPGQPTAPTVQPGPVQAGAAVEIGSGVVVYPPGGWTVVGSEPGQTVFQKGGAILIVGALPWTDTPMALATAYRDAFFTNGELRGNDPQTIEIGNGVPAVGFGYTGILQGSQVDGAMFAGASDGTGVVVNVFGSTGTLRGLSDDIDAVLNTIQLTGGQQ